jgi:hypothetical protein
MNWQQSLLPARAAPHPPVHGSKAGASARGGHLTVCLEGMVAGQHVRAPVGWFLVVLHIVFSSYQCMRDFSIVILFRILF